MKSIVSALAVIGILFGASPALSSDLINGAGSTFAAPLYSKWASEYPNVKMNYQSIGSGGGIKQVEAGTVDFGATDKPLDAQELNKYNLMQFPTAVGGIVLTYNIPGNPKIVLTSDQIVEIFSGLITNWIQVGGPNLGIQVLYRTDGSGTTYQFTSYLSKVSDFWKNNIGANTVVDWPRGAGAKGNEGVAALSKTILGGIGYVEYTYAKNNNITIASFKDDHGNIIDPNPDTFAKAIVPGTNDYLNSSVPGAWPIVSGTYVLVPNVSPNKKKVVDFFSWALQNGDKSASELGYVPLPSFLKEIK